MLQVCALPLGCAWACSSFTCVPTSPWFSRAKSPWCCTAWAGSKEPRRESISSNLACFSFPFPIDRVIRVPVKEEGEVLVEELWKPLADSGPPSEIINPLVEGYCLTGDQNLLQARLVAKFRITDPVAFALSIESPTVLVHDAVMAATTETIAGWPVDDALRLRRADARKPGAARSAGCPTRLDAVHCGLTLSALEFKEVHPPRHVRAEFEKVQSARVEKDTKRREAEGFASREAPKAAAERSAQQRSYRQWQQPAGAGHGRGFGVRGAGSRKSTESAPGSRADLSGNARSSYGPDRQTLSFAAKIAAGRRAQSTCRKGRAHSDSICPRWLGSAGKPARTVLTLRERFRISTQLGSILLAAGLLGVAFLQQWFGDSAQRQMAEWLKAIAALIVSAPIFVTAIRGIFIREADDVIEQLVALAVLAALVSGEFTTAALVPLILILGHFLEQRSILGAQAAIDGWKR